MNVRPGIEADIPHIIRMGRMFWDQTAYREILYCPDSIAQTAREMMANELLLVATTEEKVIGAVGAVMTPLYANRSVLIASELYWWVEPQFRDGGAGKLLIAGIEDAARAKGVALMGMMSLDAVEPEKAKAIYLRLGYVPGEHTYIKVL